MFGIGLPEMLLILAVALIVVGPDKLPDLAKTLARQFVELKKAAQSLKENVSDELREDLPAQLKPPTSSRELSDLFESNFERAQPKETVSSKSDPEPPNEDVPTNNDQQPPDTIQEKDRPYS